MANLPKYTDDDFNNKGMEVDFNLKKVFDMPTIEQMIFFHVNFDKCRKEIIRFENARNTINSTIKHPKETKAEALSLLKCHSENLTFEPACLESFNDARECLFKLDGQMRLCHNELELFEECVHDPVRFDKFTKLATPAQRIPKEYFTSMLQKDYYIENLMETVAKEAVAKTVTLNSGHTMPTFGLGVFDVKDQGVITDSIVEFGYRHIDTAKVYGNEELVGKAIADATKPQNFKRDSQD